MNQSIVIWRMPALATVQVGPLYLVPNTSTLVVSYAQSERSGLQLIDLARTRADLMNLEALERVRRGELEAAVEILERAVAVSPSSGDAFYNLACLHARMGQIARAKGELQIALGIDWTRYRALAVEDDDLEALRRDPEVRRWIGSRRGPSGLRAQRDPRRIDQARASG